MQITCVFVGSSTNRILSEIFQLKDEVCSPGGTTISGIQTLERSGLRSALIDAVDSATKRAVEIATLQKSQPK